MILLICIHENVSLNKHLKKIVLHAHNNFIRIFNRMKILLIVLKFSFIIQLIIISYGVDIIYYLFINYYLIEKNSSINITYYMQHTTAVGKKLGVAKNRL